MPEPLHGHGFERANICAAKYPEEEHPLRDGHGCYAMMYLARTYTVEAVCIACKREAMEKEAGIAEDSVHQARRGSKKPRV